MANAQEIKEFSSFSKFEQAYLQPQQNDTIYVLNFWATWCRPCVKELPLFDSLTTVNSKPIKVVLISLDFGVDVVEQFVKRKQVKNEVVLLSDPKSNDWINKINSNWSGAIPYTLVRQAERQLHYERSYHSLKELNKDIQKITQ